MRGTIDEANLRSLVSGPGTDTRQWVSYGFVAQDTSEARSVIFKDKDGVPLETGPLVTVALQPSGALVACRVASWVAGIGEGSWFPFQERDEVIVAIPGGDEGAGPVIIGRLNQALDTFPTVVAGADPTKNNVAFIRIRPPLILESAEAVLIHNAKTGAQISLSGEGNALISDGARNHLFFSSDVVALETGDKEVFVQLQVASKRLAFKAGAAQLQLANSILDTSFLLAPGTFNLGTSGAAGKGHAVSTEQLMATLANLVCGLAAAGAFAAGSPFGAPAWPASSPVVLDALLAALYTAQGGTTPIGTGGLPGGSTATLSTASSALRTALASPTPTLDATGLIPGVGVPGLIY